VSASALKRRRLMGRSPASSRTGTGAAVRISSGFYGSVVQFNLQMLDYQGFQVWHGS